MTPVPPQVVQIALVSADLPGTVRRYTEVFGFADAGGRALWGPWLARIQDLGADACAMLWWMVGRQDLVQLEVFAYTDPVSRPLPNGWRPSDVGWSGVVLAVPDFDALLVRLRATGVEPLAPPAEIAGVRRFAFRDPDIGVTLEVLEDGPRVPGGVRPRHWALAPAVVAATLTVADLAAARPFLVETLGLAPVAADLHPPGTAALRGLPADAAGETLLLRGAGDMLLEVTEFRTPASRPRPADHRLSDLGIMNVAVGYRERVRTDALLARIAAAGYAANAELPDTPAGGVYITGPGGTSFEIVAQPRDFDADFGFSPHPDLMRAPGWAETDVPPSVGA